MKQLLLLFVVSVFSTSLFAQLGKGQWLVGGNAGFSYQKTKEIYPPSNPTSKQTLLDVSPGFGYFFLDKLAAGVRLSTTFQSNTSPYGDSANESKTKYTGIGVSPFVRYYFLPKANKVNLLAEVGYTYFTGRESYYYSGRESGYNKQHHSAYSFAAGPSFFLNPKTALEVLAEYTFEDNKAVPEKINTFMLNVGFQIYLGK